jgi:hypothetical protein
MSDTRSDVEFHAKVLKVEERFDRVYKKTFGEAKTEGEGGYDQVSNGWWVVLEGWPVAIRFGNLKPNCEAGDTIAMEWRIYKKKSS